MSSSSLVSYGSDLAAVIAERASTTCSDGCLAGWKGGFAAILFIEGIVFGHVVYLLKKVSKAGVIFDRALHFGHALSAGVFFAAGVMHVLPEAVELFSGEGGHGGHGGGHEEEHEEEHEGEHLHRQIEDRNDEDHSDEDHSDEEEGEEEHGASFPWVFFILMVSFYALFFIEKLLAPRLTRKAGGNALAEDEESRVASGSDFDNEMHNLKALQGEAAGFGSPLFLAGLVQILGLSAHSLFESLSLGLSKEFSVVLNVFIATVTHRWATATALAFKLAPKLRYFPFLVLLVLFSSAVPLGVGVGAALTSVSSTVQGALFAISAGTFLYIGVFESMAEEFVEHRKWLFGKFFAMLAGAGIIVVITAILVGLDVHG